MLLYVKIFLWRYLPMNRKLFFKIYSFTCTNQMAKKIGIFIAKYSEALYYLIYFLGAVIILLNNPSLLVKYLIIPFVVLMYNTLLRKILKRPRPFVAENIESLIKHKANGSCPSNHAASSMIISFAWWCVYPYFTFIFGVIALFTGLSRIMTGVHYPKDVIIGWFIGIFFGIIGFVM